MDRQKLNLFLGKTNDWEFVFLESAFKYEDWMSGLTYNVFEFKTEDDKDNDEESYFDDTSETEYMFCEYIKYSHDWNTSVNDWIEMVKDERQNWACYDDSYSWEEWLEDAMEYASEVDDEDYEYSNCRWWWRLWKDSVYSDIDNYEYTIADNWDRFQKLLVEYEI